MMQRLNRWLGKVRMSRGQLVILLAGSIAILICSLMPVQAQNNLPTPRSLSDQSKVAIDGIGPIRVGMTLQAAVDSANTPMTLKPGAGVGNNCGFANPATGPRGLEFMVTNGRIARVDVLQNSKITTISGAKIGDSEARIKALYPQRLTVTPHPYVRQGHYLIFVPRDAADQKYRLIFETDGQKVTRFRAGQRPEVEYIEGCA